MNQTPNQARHGPTTASTSVPWGELWSHRGYLIRFAERRLRDPTLAEDAVHDVFEAIIRGQAAFGGRCALRSWLTGVLKHKIVDLVRRRSDIESTGTGDSAAEFAAFPCPRPRPDEVAEQRELLARTLNHIDALPPTLREAITLRVLHDQPTETVCAALSINENNLFQRLFRARQQLAAAALCH